MSISEILAELDEEIARLQKARTLLSNEAKRGPGRPKKQDTVKEKAPKKKLRNLSPEGRKRIAEAVKRRWAAQKKSASGK